MKKDFWEYDIVKYLKEKDSIYYVKIQELYNICEGLLLQIPKEFPNYTLHDIGHSVRVIGYMNQLIKKHLRDFSDLHIALTICVGLLHDIGMVVSENEKRDLYDKFERTNYKFRNMSPSEKNFYFQEFIRKNHGKRVANVMNCNINKNMKIRSLFCIGHSLAYDLSEIVSMICQSHTESCDWVHNLPLNCEYANDIINPRHIAFLLRIGDALDIDDRRAPYILYKMLNPQGISDEEWKKHIPITNYNKIKNREGLDEIIFSGTCKEPNVYRKIMEYINYLEADLEKIVKFSSQYQSPYQLKIKLPIKNEIITQGFINTALRFKLNYNQVINLLMGEKIYGNKRDGLRELLQNAIDAVMLMQNIHEKNFAYGVSSYVPEIRIIVNEKENHFEIVDNGTGMTEEILEKYFFNVGNSYYLSDEFNVGDYEYQPIGHFGIGFLACFMLSSVIQLETKHYNSAEGVHMIFDKESPYITKLDRQNESSYIKHGTRIILEYDRIIPEIFQNDNDIIMYIKKLLITDDFHLYFINQDKKETTEIKGPHLENNFIKNDEQIDFTYKLAKDMAIRFDVRNFFNDNNNVFIAKYFKEYNEMEYVSLAYYEESLDWLEAAIQLKENSLSEILNNVEEILDLPISEFVIAMILDNCQEILSKNVSYDELHDYFEKTMYEFMDNSIFEWYDIPIILKQEVFEGFIECVDEEGINEGLRQYSNAVRYISVLTKEEMTDKIVLDIVEIYLESYGAIRDIIDVSYYEKYPILPIKKKVRLLSLPYSKICLQLIENVKKIDASYYLKGIRINGESIIPSYIIKGINLHDVCINIKKGKFETDVARNNFDFNSREKLLNIMMCMIYEDVIKKNFLSSEEVELVRLFLDEFYR